MITHFRQAIEETLPWLSSFGADPAGGMTRLLGNDSNLLIVFYVQIMPDDFVMQLHRF